MKRRAIVYIDGFNFYYGAVRGTRHKWLDLEGCFRRLRPHNELVAIRYFTALVTGAQSTNQRTYLDALATTPLVEVVLGKFKRKEVQCSVRGCSYGGRRVFQVPEEKRTDVNIAIQLLDDAVHDRADDFIIVSGDSDLVPAIELVKVRAPAARIVVYVPARHRIRGAATELRSAADKDKTFPQTLLSVSQFPPTLRTGRGGTISKPEGW